MLIVTPAVSKNTLKHPIHLPSDKLLKNKKSQKATKVTFRLQDKSMITWDEFQRIAM